jgi:hypothetical protein
MTHQHQKQWIFLKTAIDSNQLAHAYLNLRLIWKGVLFEF